MKNILRQFEVSPEQAFKHGLIAALDLCSEQIQIEAVKQNVNLIQYIKNPSEQVQLEAVKQSGDSIKYIKNPSEEVIKQFLVQLEQTLSRT